MLLPSHYTTLPDQFYARLTPHSAPAAPSLLALNAPLARSLGLDPAWLTSDAGLAFLTHGKRPDGLAPVAMAYAGHQFGHFNPTLGDGRAMLIGDARDASGQAFELHLKGSGPTPFSRRGDGRAALGPVMREYIVSEAMHALGLPTTRALAAIRTGETVWRETPQPGAVIARVARSHIRVGTFQHFAREGDQESVRLLVDHTLDRLYPGLRERPDRALALLERVVARQADLVARWMHVGFVHGVMNTDNMAISGETIDYGPCAFLDVYNPAQVFSFIDRHGRYAYGRQPDMALWNLSRLAEALLPQIDANTDTAVAKARNVLEGFNDTFNESALSGWRRKLGLTRAEEGDADLVGGFLTVLHNTEADFTASFRALSNVADRDDPGDFIARFPDPTSIADWAARWRARTRREERTPSERCRAMRAINPRIIPRNHRIEAVIQSAVAGDDTPFHALTRALADPFSDDDDGFDAPPTPQERVTQTFCGT